MPSSLCCAYVSRCPRGMITLLQLKQAVRGDVVDVADAIFAHDWQLNIALRWQAHPVEVRGIDLNGGDMIDLKAQIYSIQDCFRSKDRARTNDADDKEQAKDLAGGGAADDFNDFEAPSLLMSIPAQCACRRLTVISSGDRCLCLCTELRPAGRLYRSQGWDNCCSQSYNVS
jgi:hypothetical protein